MATTPTDVKLDQLVINSVESQEVYKKMEERGLINENEIYLVDGGDAQEVITANGILKGDGQGNITAAVAGTDYCGSNEYISIIQDSSGNWELDNKEDAMYILRGGEWQSGSYNLYLTTYSESEEIAATLPYTGDGTLTNEEGEGIGSYWCFSGIVGKGLWTVKITAQGDLEVEKDSLSYVSYNNQSLTDIQKAQARTNIAAANTDTQTVVFSTSATSVSESVTAANLSTYLSNLPRLLNKNYTITVSGTYTGKINISGFYGSGSITITGGSSAGNCVLNHQMTISNCSIPITLTNITWENADSSLGTGQSYLLVNSSTVVLNGCVFTGHLVNSNRRPGGISVQNNGVAYSSNCTFKTVTFCAQTHLSGQITLYSTDSSLFEDTYQGVSIYYGGIIILSGKTPDTPGSTWNSVNGGLLVYNNGTIKKAITADSATTATTATSASKATTADTATNVKNVPSHNHIGQSLNPAALELNPGTSASHGGYIDFHYKGSSADYTSRIIEASSGALYAYATEGFAVPDSGVSTNIYRARNEAFASSDTTPSVNGHICWTYS